MYVHQNRDGLLTSASVEGEPRPGDLVEGTIRGVIVPDGPNNWAVEGRDPQGVRFRIPWTWLDHDKTWIIRGHM